MEVLAGVFVVAGIVAVGARFAPRTPAGQVRLPRIVDESIGMWALRSLRSRLVGLPSPEVPASPPEPAMPVAPIREASALSDHAPAATSPVIPAAPALAAAAPAPAATEAPANLTATASPWLADPADSRFAATPLRLAAVGVRPVPRWVGPAPAPSPWSPRDSPTPTLLPPLRPRPAPGPTSTGPFVLSPADPPARFRSPVEPVLSPMGRRAGVAPGWTSRRAARSASSAPVIAAAPSRAPGLARLRASGAAVATTLTFLIVALVAIASILAPGRAQGEVLAATGRPGATVRAGQASAQPSSSSSIRATPAPSSSRSKAKPTPTTRP